MGMAQEYLRRYYGFSSETRSAVTVIGAAAPVRLLPNNPDRVAWLAVNLGANLGYVHFQGDVAALNGIQLNAAGGTASFTIREDGEIVTNEVWAIGAGASTMYVVETVGRL